jgi:hypothetical protein
MRVTDCGCFGDFLKLKPKVSFFKDLFLLVPALYFLFKHRLMHEQFTVGVRRWATVLASVGFAAFCYYNTFLNEPVVDFRPFRAGVDVRGTREREAAEEAEAYKVLAYKMKNKASGQVITVPIEQYMKEYEKYPEAEWDMEQVKKNPDYEHTKISEFEITAPNGENMTDALLQDSGYFLMVVAYKLLEQGRDTIRSVRSDSTFMVDSITMAKTFTGMKETKVEKEQVKYDPEYVSRYTEVINPVIHAAKGTGVKFFAATAINEQELIEQFKQAAGCQYPFFTADDLLLKTIQRSNPGIVLWHDGKILDKWHYKDMPSFEEIKAKYIKL